MIDSKMTMRPEEFDQVGDGPISPVEPVAQTL